MAYVKIEDVVDHLSHDMKRALESAVGDALPEAHVDRNELFRAFKRGVRRKCSTWEQVPDHLVRVD